MLLVRALSTRIFLHIKVHDTMPSEIARLSIDIKMKFPIFKKQYKDNQFCLSLFSDQSYIY